MNCCAEIVRHAVARQFKRSRVFDGDRLVDDLGGDDLDRIEIVTEIEFDLGIVIPDEAFRFETVSELVELVDQILSEKGSNVA